nr:PEPxxWA-CTERM sorting domain-containing protein [Polymorphobacter sp.]
MKTFTITSALAMALLASTAASGVTLRTPKPFTVKGPKLVIPPNDIQVDMNGASAPVFYAPSVATSVVSSFEGTSDYDTRALGIGLIPPDTMGAVGTTQYVQLINGSFSVYNKATGTLAGVRKTDSSFWTAAGGTSTGGDPRILFDKGTNRWLAIGFGSPVSKLQIAVSETDNALGAWHAASFTGFAGLGFGGTADYPTLAISGNSILIGTNNFAPATSGGTNSFRGTTLNVLNKGAVFAAGGPTGTVLQFNTPLDFVTDNGFAIQGVNRQGGSSTASVIAASLYEFDNVAYTVENAGKLTATQTTAEYLGSSSFVSPLKARQPTTNGSARVVDTLDERISANAWEIKGKVYFLQTVMLPGSDHSVVRVTVYDKNTNAILSETNIGASASNSFDYFQGSLAVNSAGQVVVSYNRSGDISTGVDGRISIFARSYNTNADGSLASTSGEVLIKQSLVNDYHNGSAEGVDPAGRQRWGDYSTVTLDPTNNHRFWVIGQFAREFNNAAGGHPGGSGFGRWGTYVAQIGIGAVPEPQSWAMLIAGFGIVGAAMRRQRRATTVTA